MNGDVVFDVGSRGTLLANFAVLPVVVSNSDCCGSGDAPVSLSGPSSSLSEPNRGLLVERPSTIVTVELLMPRTM